MDRISDEERRRIAELLAEGAPVWRLHREINRSRFAIRRAVIALQRPARLELPGTSRCCRSGGAGASTSVSGVSPAGRIAARAYLRGLAAVERGDFDQALSQFRPDCEFVFVSHTALGARLAGHADLRRWFERFRRLLPDPAFDVQRLVIGGPVWDQRVAAHVIIRSRVAGEPYQNQFAQFLALRWGKVAEDLILEDTATWEAASRRLAAAGDTEAAAPPLTAKPA